MAQVKVYIWTSCPYCLRACSLLDDKNVSYEKIILDGKNSELSALRQKTGHRTVPQIFINEEFIGGYDDLAALESSGNLDKMLGNS